MIKSNLLPEITLDMHTSTSLIYAKDRLVVFRKQTALKMFPLSSTIFKREKASARASSDRFCPSILKPNIFKY